MDPCRLLEWDTAHWGIPIARVNRDRLDPADLPAIDAWCATNGIACLTLLIDCADRTSAAAAHAAGFFPADTRLTLSRSFTGFTPRPVSGRVRPASEQDLPGLRDLAASSHEDTRFFFDRRFPERPSRDLYGRWLERALHDDASTVLISVIDDRLAGYVVGSCPAGGPHANVGLLAVEPAMRGQGVGGELVDAVLAWCVERGAATVDMVTQGRNIASQSLFQRVGFRTSACAVWLHRWSAEPGRTPQ